MFLRPFKKKRKVYRAGKLRFAARVVVLGFRVLVVAVVLSIVAALVWIGWTLHGFLARPDYFALKEIVVSGSPLDKTVADQVEETLALQKVRRRNLLLLNVDEIRGSLEAIPKVKSALVRKHYPARLSVEVTQREPVALLLRDPIVAVDIEGAIIEILRPRDPRLLQFPFISGVSVGSCQPGEKIKSEILTRCLVLISCLQRRALTLLKKTSELHCDNEDNITLLLKGGTEIRFGSGNPVEKMPALETFLGKMGPPERFAYIDLRFEGQVPCKPRQEVARKTTSP